MSESRLTAKDCVFCARVKSGQFEYDNNYCAAFQPLRPVTPGHFLVIPKRHIVSALCDPVKAAHAMRFAAELANEMGLGAVNFITSAGAAATQTVYHLHVHVVPRREGDGLALPWSPQ